MCGVNYPISIVDDACITSWYDESELTQYTSVTREGVSREMYDVQYETIAAAKEYVMPDDQAVLINVDKWHGFKNGPNTRIILTMRPILALDFAAAAAKLRKFKCS